MKTEENVLNLSKGFKGEYESWEGCENDIFHDMFVNTFEVKDTVTILISTKMAK